MAFPDGDDDRIADDGIQRDGEDGDASAGTLELAPVEHDLGFILEEPDLTKVARHVAEMREDRNAERSRNRAIWQRSAWWREGRRGIKLEKAQDQQKWEVKLPRGALSAPPVPNKTDRLCRRVTNTLLVDKPYPDCMPGSDTNEDRDAAEFSTRYLAEIGAPANLNVARIMRSAHDKSETYASAYAWVTMDPGGNGHRPRTMLAHPDALHSKDALIDPATQMEAPEDQLTERYMRPDGYLCDDPQDADLQWLPGPKVRILTGLQLDLLPATARGIDDAIGIIITDSSNLGDLKQLFPKTFEKLSKDKIAELVKWKPDNLPDILPPHAPSPKDQTNEDGSYKDSQIVFTMTVYYRSCAEYPFGCYAVIGGDQIVLHRQKWTAQMTDREGNPVEEGLDIPVSQCRCLDDDTYDNPHGIALAEKLGPADEIRHTSLGFELEHMFREANPMLFVPHGSIVQPKAMLLRDGTPQYTNPNGKPEWEAVPQLSPTVRELREEMSTEMDDESGLQQAAQGVEGPDVNSGIHAQTIVQEALKALTNMKDNLGDFYIRLNQVILQLSRAYCTVPQLLEYTGENGQYKMKEWSRVDFRTTKRVSIAKGSYTMHTLLAKQEMANNAFDRKIIDADEYQELVAGGVAPVLGVQDNPHLMRVRRQIDKWLDGPTEQWLQDMATLEQRNAEVAATQLVSPDGQPMAPQPPIPPPEDPFTFSLPVDDEPMPAKIRHRQLSRTQADTKFQTMPKPWQDVLLREYAKAKNAAGVMTVAEVQAAKQQEQQAAQQAQQQAAAAEMAKTQFDQEMAKEKLALEAKKVEQADRDLPKGVTASMKADSGTIGADIAAAQGLTVPHAIEHERDPATGALVASTVHPMNKLRIVHNRDHRGAITHSEVAPLPS